MLHHELLFVIFMFMFPLMFANVLIQCSSQWVEAPMNYWLESTGQTPSDRTNPVESGPFSSKKRF